MSKPLKPGDVDKLKGSLQRISSLRNCIKILSDDSPPIVSITGTGIKEAHDRFFVMDSQTKASISESIKLLLIAEKNAIRKKYDIDIK